MKTVVFGSKNFGTKNNPNLIAEKLSAQCYYWEDLLFDIQSNQIVVTTADGRDIFAEPFDLAICMGWYKSEQGGIYRDLALCLASILSAKGIQYWNSEMGLQRSTTKLSQMVKLSLGGILVPHTYFSLNPSLFLDRLSDHTPYVVKAAAASRGRHNYLVSNLSEMHQIFQSHSLPFLVQELIPNDHDLRLICFGGEAKLLLKRSRRDNSTHLNNTSQGGSAEWLPEIPQDLQALAVRITQLLGREMGGIDFIETIDNSDQKYYCLEVNAIPQLTSGTDVDRKMAALIATING